MKLYANTCTERACKGQGGNDYLITEFHITSKDSYNYRIHTVYDEIESCYITTFQKKFFGKLYDIAKEKIYINKEK